MRPVAGAARQQQPAFVSSAHFRRAIALRGDQRWPKSYQKFEFLFVAFGCFWKIAAQNQRALDQFRGFRIRESLLGYFGRRAVIVNRPVPHSRGVVMRGQPSANALQLGSVQFFQSAGYAPVQGSSAHGTQFAIRHLAQHVVRVIISAGALAVDDAALP